MHNHFKELGVVSAEEKFSHLKFYIEEYGVTDLNSNADSHLLECEGNKAATTRLRQNFSCAFIEDHLAFSRSKYKYNVRHSLSVVKLKMTREFRLQQNCI